MVGYATQHRFSRQPSAPGRKLWVIVGHATGNWCEQLAIGHWPPVLARGQPMREFVGHCGLCPRHSQREKYASGVGVHEAYLLTANLQTVIWALDKIFDNPQ